MLMDMYGADFLEGNCRCERRPLRKFVFSDPGIPVDIYFKKILKYVHKDFCEECLLQHYLYDENLDDTVNIEKWDALK